jgi:Zn finger protein HypA/HybF involved in hydrogenase expression
MKLEVYCMKCKEQREAKDVKQITLENGKPALEGTCPVCDSKLLQIIYPNACQ